MTTTLNELIPKEFLKPLIAIVKGTRTLDRDKGEWSNETEPQTDDFIGAIMPITFRELNALKATHEGIYSIEDRKLYTDKIFLNKTQIQNVDGTMYTINDIARDYGTISTLKVYYLKRLAKIDG
jgi:hypothetical protein